MKRALIHIGTEKTGTTSIQEFLHANREQLAKQGVGYLKTPGLKNNRKLVTYCMSDDYIDDQVKDLEIVTDELRQSWKQKFREEITNEINCLNSNIHSLIISSEHFHSRFRYDFEVKNLLDFLSPFVSEVKIVAYLRRQDEMAVSLYSTLCKNGWSRESIFPEYTSPEDHYYNYFEMLERWSRVFGHDSIILRIFERSKLEEKDIIADFIKSSKILENDPSFKMPDIQNESLSSTAQEVLVSFNKSLPKYEGVAPNHFFNYLRGNLINNLQASFKGLPRLPTQEEAIKFYNIFHDSNKKLAKKYFLDDIFFSEDFSRYPKFPQSADIDKSTLDVIFHTMQTCLQILPPLSSTDIEQQKKREKKSKKNTEGIASAMDVYEKARFLHEKGNLEDAVLTYQRAIKINPSSPSFYQSLGDVLSQLKRWEEAIKAFRNALKHNTEDRWVYYCIGYALAAKGSWEEAVKMYFEAISSYGKTTKSLPNLDEFDSHSNSYFLHFKLGEYFIDQELHNKAIIALHNCLEINPNFIPAYKSLSVIFNKHDRLEDASRNYLALGEAFCRSKNLDDAIMAFKKSVELDSNFCWSYNCLGNVYYWKGDLDKAIASYQKAVELKPDLTAAYQQLGDIHSARGDINGATTYYDLALKYETREEQALLPTA